MGPGADGRWRPEAPNAPSTENFLQEIFVSRCVSLALPGYRWIPLPTWDVVTPGLHGGRS